MSRVEQGNGSRAPCVWTPRIVGIGLLVVFAVPACAYFVYAARLIAYPYVWENGEGIVLADAQAIFRGESPYRDLKAYPFLVANYPPLYTSLCAAGMWLAGPRSYAPGRVLSLLATLAIMLASAGVVYRQTRCALLACGGCLGILSVGCITRMGPICRVDILAAAFSIGGVWLTLRQVSTRRWVGPAALFLLAGYTKHSAVAGLAACITYLWATDRRKALKTTVAIAAVGGGLLVAFELATGGNFLRHIVQYTWTRFEWHFVWAYVRGGLRGGLLLFVLSAFGLAATTLVLARRGRAPHGRGLILLYLAFNALALVQLGKVGVAYLYLVEFAAATCLAFPLLVHDLCTLGGDRVWAQRAAAVAAIAAAACQVAGDRQTTAAHLRPIVGHSESLWASVIERAHGPVLAEDVGRLITAGKPALVNPFILSQLGAPTRYAYEDGPQGRRRTIVPNRTTPALARAHERVLEDIRAGKFALIQTNTILDARLYGAQPPRRWAMQRTITDQRFSPQWQNAIAERYRLERTIGIGAAYAPR